MDLTCLGTLHHINFPVIQTLCSSCHVYIWYIDYVFTSYSMLATVFYGSCRVWRYRGGRDGHETLQQFMNFLGRGQEIQLESDTRQGLSQGTTAGRI